MNKHQCYYCCWYYTEARGCECPHSMKSKMCKQAREAKEKEEAKINNKVMDLEKFKNRALEIATKKGWNQGSTKHYICLVISELMEAVEADRKNKHADLLKFYDNIRRDKFEGSIERFGEDFYTDIWKEGFRTFIKDTVEDELADAFIRLLHLAGLRKLDLSESEITILYGPNIQYNTFTEWVFEVVRDLVDSDNTDERSIKEGLTHIFSYCLHHNINLEAYVREKMKYNEFLLNSIP